MPPATAARSCVASFLLPLHPRPVVLDAAYLPKETALLKQASSAGCHVIPGVEMLIAQGIAQQHIFTNQHPASGVITKIVMQEYEVMTSKTPMSIRSRAEPSELNTRREAKVSAI